MYNPAIAFITIDAGIALVAVLIALGVELAVQWMRARRPRYRIERGRKWN